MSNYEVRKKKEYLRDKYRVLRGFDIKVTDEIQRKIESMYPNFIAIDNYARKLILDRLK